jgi:C4-dicarboxylate-specific signal transduction histidine kinase
MVAIAKLCLSCRLGLLAVAMDCERRQHKELNLAVRNLDRLLERAIPLPYHLRPLAALRLWLCRPAAGQDWKQCRQVQLLLGATSTEVGNSMREVVRLFA